MLYRLPACLQAARSSRACWQLVRALLCSVETANEVCYGPGERADNDITSIELLVSYTASQSQVKLFAIPATPTDDFRDGFGGFRSLAFFALLLDPLGLGCHSWRTRADSSSRDALLASISIRVQAAATIRAVTLRGSSQKAITSSASCSGCRHVVDSRSQARSSRTCSGLQWTACAAKHSAEYVSSTPPPRCAACSS